MTAIVTLTMNPAIDVSTTAERVHADEKLRCQPPQRQPGGGGINVGRVIARLGAEVIVMYPAGGPTGEELNAMLEGEELDNRRIVVDGHTRQNLMVTESATSAQYRFVMPGPQLSEEDYARCLDALTEFEPPPEYVVASGSLPPGAPEDLYAQVSRRMKEAGSRVIVDTSGPELRAAADEGVFLLKPNASELKQLCDDDLETEADFEEAAAELATSGAAEVVALSLGAGGAFVATSDGERQRLHTPAVSIQSRVGAGDSMVGGMVAGLASGLDALDAVRLGLAAGAATVTMPGSLLARGEDVETLFNRIKEQH